MLPFITARPGIVVLHDPTLHHLINIETAATGDVERYVDALGAEHGIAGRILGEQYRDCGLRGSQQFFDMTMIRGVTGPSRGVIVHSQYAAIKVLSRSPSTAVTVVAHPHCAPATEEDLSSVRKEVGVEQEELLFASLGFIHARRKQIDKALLALASIRDQCCRCLNTSWQVVISRRTKGISKVLTIALGLEKNVIFVGYVTSERFFSLTRAADVVINLRHPIGGETSGSMVRALGAGACVVVVDRGPFSEIPDEAAVRIPWQSNFEVPLAKELLRFGIGRGSARTDRLECSDIHQRK